MESIAKYLNYKLDIQPPPNGEMWGENKNGSFSGLVGELLGVDLSYSDDVFIILDWNLIHGFISISTSTTCLSSVQMM